jgi:hypothetical protein
MRLLFTYALHYYIWKSFLIYTSVHWYNVLNRELFSTYTFGTIFDLYPSAFLLWKVLQLSTSTRNYFGYGPEHLVLSQPILDLHIAATEVSLALIKTFLCVNYSGFTLTRC